MSNDLIAKTAIDRHLEVMRVPVVVASPAGTDAAEEEATSRAVASSAAEDSPVVTDGLPPSSGRLVDDGPRAHTCPFALAVAPGREAPTTAAVLGDIVASRATDHV